MVPEDQGVQDIVGAVGHMALHLREVRNLDLVDLEDHLAYQMEVLDADVTFGDEEDKGMAAAVDDRKAALSEVLPEI